MASGGTTGAGGGGASSRFCSSNRLMDIHPLGAPLRLSPVISTPTRFSPFTATAMTRLVDDTSSVSQPSSERASTTMAMASDGVVGLANSTRTAPGSGRMRRSVTLSSVGNSSGYRSGRSGARTVSGSAVRVDTVAIGPGSLRSTRNQSADPPINITAEKATTALTDARRNDGSSACTAVNSSSASSELFLLTHHDRVSTAKSGHEQQLVHLSRSNRSVQQQTNEYKGQDERPVQPPRASAGPGGHRPIPDQTTGTSRWIGPQEQTNHQH